ncbi:Long-chain base-1-phosphate phosphatase [Tilletia horrida]|uniref:Long-chain base-1-phosphate phosphatase n=1 Tax=Tilletia horrida TaxID=155126 RepID=A0AAN6GPN8_9BASI|nr:Long-chain base-1-phosphate phosphatase [Tilletia horrida]
MASARKTSGGFGLGSGSSSSNHNTLKPTSSTSVASATPSSASMLLPGDDAERDLLALTSGLRNGSAASSKAGQQQQQRRKDKESSSSHEEEEHFVDAGTLPAHLYDAYLPGWVAWTRRLLMRHIAAESRWIAKLQHAYRTPRRDRYFVSTALLGTHSFFLIFLPLSFWLGSPYFGRGLINVLAFGVYLTSALKDLVCVPRPLSPPVVRLSVGTHHLEYGFPSTHSANAVSIALYCYLWVLDYRSAAAQAGAEGGAGWLDSKLWEVFLSYYALSVVGGRIYAGMHSLTDCIAGSILGALITWAQWWLFPLMERSLVITSWVVPAVIIPVGLAMVTFHPQPMDDCPCFEDAIAFIAVAMGVTIGRWFVVRNGLALIHDHPSRPQPFQPYDPSVIFQHIKFLPKAAASRFGDKSAITSLTRHLVHGNRFVTTGISAARVAGDSWSGWAARALAKFVVGSLVLVVVRIAVKASSKLLLPPTFRFVYRILGFALPRRYYTPAQEYDSIPQDLRPIPSVLDLSSVGKAVAGGPFEPNRALSPSPQPSRVSSPNPLPPYLRATSPQFFQTRSGSPLAALRQPPGHALSVNTTALSNSPSNVPHRRAQFSLGVDSASGEGSPLSLSGSLSSLPPRSGTATPPNASLSRQMPSSNRPPIVENPLGVNVAVPITQTQGRQANGLDIPGEDAPEKIADAIGKGIHSHPGGQHDTDIKRYDADVLTKVLTYSAIGLFGSALLPVFFEHIGWIRP